MVTICTIAGALFIGGLGVLFIAIAGCKIYEYARIRFEGKSPYIAYRDGYYDGSHRYESRENKYKIVRECQ